MAQTFAKYAGIIQTLVGVLGQFGPTAITNLLKSGTDTGIAGNNIIGIITGLALSYFGFKGSEGQQRMGAQVVGGLSGLVGLLGSASVNIPGLQLSQGLSGTNIISLLIGAWGLYSGFAKKPAGATAH